VLEYTLVEHRELAIEAGVDLQILRRLHKDGPEKLIVIGIDREPRIKQIIMIVRIVHPHLLSIICDKAIAVDPEQVWPYRHDSMAQFLILARRRNYL